MLATPSEESQNSCMWSARSLQLYLNLIHLSIYLSVCLSIYLSIYLPVHLSVCLFQALDPLGKLLATLQSTG